MTLTWLLTLAVSPNSIEQMRVEIQCLETHGWLPTDKHWIQEIEFMLVASRQRIAMMSENIHACINGISLNTVDCSKCLGVEIDEFFTWNTHIASDWKKVSSGISIGSRSVLIHNYNYNYITVSRGGNSILRCNWSLIKLTFKLGCSIYCNDKIATSYFWQKTVPFQELLHWHWEGRKVHHHLHPYQDLSMKECCRLENDACLAN